MSDPDDNTSERLAVEEDTAGRRTFESISNEDVDLLPGAIENDANDVIDSYIDFIRTFLFANGAVPLLLTVCFVATGAGCTVGVVPDLMAERYARIRHGYDGIDDCSTFDRSSKPESCLFGSDDAQQAAAIATLITNLLTLLCNSILGSLSDVHGRRCVLILSMFLATLSPFVLVLMQILPGLDPFWFYAANTTVGMVNYVSLSFAALSDVIPPKYRTLGFGFFLGTFFLWFCLSPSVTFFLTHFQVSLFSCLVVLLGFIYTVLFLPETLPPDIAQQNRSSLQVRLPDDIDGNSNPTSPSTSAMSLLKLMVRPVVELSILNRNAALRLIAIGSFLSGMVYSSDATLVLYYMEEQLNVRDSDLARMFLVMGLVGVVIQAFLLKFLITALGETNLLVLSFVSGTCHNFLYGVARTKALLYVALSLSQLTKTNFPLLSSIAASQVSSHEQGRIQGALFALSALANALGPMTLEYVYDQCKKPETSNFLTCGPGTMFVVAAFLYALGTVCVSFLLSVFRKEAVPHPPSEQPYNLDESGMDDPLLNPDNTTV